MSKNDDPRPLSRPVSPGQWGDLARLIDMLTATAEAGDDLSLDDPPVVSDEAEEAIVWHDMAYSIEVLAASALAKDDIAATDDIAEPVVLSFPRYPDTQALFGIDVENRTDGLLTRHRIVQHQWLTSHSTSNPNRAGAPAASGLSRSRVLIRNWRTLGALAATLLVGVLLWPMISNELLWRPVGGPQVTKDDPSPRLSPVEHDPGLARSLAREHETLARVPETMFRHDVEERVPLSEKRRDLQNERDAERRVAVDSARIRLLLGANAEAGLFSLVGVVPVKMVEQRSSVVSEVERSSSVRSSPRWGRSMIILGKSVSDRHVMVANETARDIRALLSAMNDYGEFLDATKVCEYADQLTSRPDHEIATELLHCLPSISIAELLIADVTVSSRQNSVTKQAIVYSRLAAKVVDLSTRQAFAQFEVEVEVNTGRVVCDDDCVSSAAMNLTGRLADSFAVKFLEVLETSAVPRTRSSQKSTPPFMLDDAPDMARDLGPLVSQAVDIQGAFKASQTASFYKVSLAQASTFKVLVSKNTSDIEVALVNSARKEMVRLRQTSKTADWIETAIPAGVYYVAVHNSGKAATPYSMSVDVRRYVNYTHKDMPYQLPKISATPVEFRTTIDNEANEHWIRFEVPSDARYRFTLDMVRIDRGVDIDLHVINKDRTRGWVYVARSENRSGENESIQTRLEPGIYFLRIWRDWRERGTGDVLVRAMLDEDGGRSPHQVSLKPQPTVVSGKPIQDCPTCPRIIAVKAACYVVGADASDNIAEDNERTAQSVRIPSFALGVTEVTVSEWAACHAKGACALAPPAGVDPNMPMMGVSAEDARAFVGWLARETGQRYRLPSEAEWEYAARSGTRARYAFGDRPDTSKARFSPRNQVAKSAATVGSYAANEFGLFDMSGNAAEIVADCYDGSHAGRPKEGVARTSCSVPGRVVVRGGSWMSVPLKVRTTSREGVEARMRREDLGFRVARDAPELAAAMPTPATCDP